MKTGNGLVAYAKEKIGTPYFYGSKMKVLTEDFMKQMRKLYPSVVTLLYMSKARIKGNVGKINVDCSGLIGAYREKQIGSSQLYSTAYTRLSINDYRSWADGVVCWRKGHVGVFCRIGGIYKVIEAKGINYGVVVSDFDPKEWTCGLTFKEMHYVYSDNVVDNATWKPVNPFVEPNRILKKGCKGDDVKWLQFELCEAGFSDEIQKSGGIDGVYGSATTKAVKALQKSCKIVVDGVVGKVTIKCLKND